MNMGKKKSKKLNIKKLAIYILLVYAGFIFIGQQFKMYKLNVQIQAAKLEESKAKDKNKKLQDEVKMSKTDDYVEKLGRERLGLIKKGETPVINSSRD